MHDAITYSISSSSNEVSTQLQLCSHLIGLRKSAHRPCHPMEYKNYVQIKCGKIWWQNEILWVIRPILWNFDKEQYSMSHRFASYAIIINSDRKQKRYPYACLLNPYSKNSQWS